jgi:hypothetical protein
MEDPATVTVFFGAGGEGGLGHGFVEVEAECNIPDVYLR